MSVARRHHTLSQTYLRRFLAAGATKPQLRVYDARRRLSFVTNIANVAVAHDFNTVKVEGQPSDALESALSKFEGVVAGALDRICAARSFRDADDRKAILNFLGMIYLRNPRWRGRMEEFIAETVKMVAQVSTSTKEIWDGERERFSKATDTPPSDAVSYEEMREFVRGEGYKIKVARDYLIGLELKTFNDILPIFFARKWSLFRAKPGTGGFITSDHPACLMWNDNKLATGPYPPGLGLTKTDLYFPLSRDLCLVGRLDDGPELEVEVDFRVVAAVNGLVVAFAERQVYASDDRFLFSRGGSALPLFGYEMFDDAKAV